MTSKTLSPALAVGGSCDVPGDKSISHRAAILGALSNRVCTIDNFLSGEDCLCTLAALRELGIVVEQGGPRVRIEGGGLEGMRAPKKTIWCGNSGTTTRLMMGVLTGQPFEARLEGDASLARRPMDRVIDPLSQMGAFFLDVKGKPAHLPLRMHGTRNVRAITWKSPIASAQVKSAVLLAGLYASGTTTFEEPSLSRDHTERMLQACSVPVARSGTRVSVTGTAVVRAHAFAVPADFSSASFIVAAGLLRSVSGLVVRRVGVNPTRTGFLDIVRSMGSSLRLVNATESSGEPIADIEIRRSPVAGVSIGGDLIARAIDEIPILAVLATQASGRTVISDAQELRVKESDRLACVREELSKMGARIEEKPDGLVIEGPTPLQGAVVKSHGDHRLAMSLAIAALVAKGDTTVEDVDCVKTSFPGFWELLESLRRAA